MDISGPEPPALLTLRGNKLFKELKIRFTNFPADCPALWEVTKGTDKNSISRRSLLLKNTFQRKVLGVPAYKPSFLRSDYSNLSAPNCTELATPYSSSTVTKVPPWEKRFTIRRSSSRTRRRSIRLSPIVEDSRLQPPVGVWAVSQSHCWGPCSHTPYPSSPWWAITSPTSW